MREIRKKIIISSREKKIQNVQNVECDACQRTYQIQQQKKLHTDEERSVERRRNNISNKHKGYLYLSRYIYRTEPYNEFIHICTSFLSPFRSQFLVILHRLVGCCLSEIRSSKTLTCYARHKTRKYSITSCSPTFRHWNGKKRKIINNFWCDDSPERII